MVNLRLSSPLNRYFMRPFLMDEEDEWPSLEMTEGMDVYEEDDKVVVKAAVPGVPADRVNVTFEEGVLSIKARIEESEEEKKKKKVVYKMDRVASFNYTTTLPRAIDPKSIEANIDDGVVVVTAKVAEEAQSRKIPVRASSKK